VTVQHYERTSCRESEREKIKEKKKEEKKKKERAPCKIPKSTKMVVIKERLGV
jgi:hypothetical protein